MCSFGDASINHSTAVGALNTAAYCAAQGLPLPIVFVCEDNGLGISVPTPHGLGGRRRRSVPASRTSSADGDDPAAVSLAAREAAEIARDDEQAGVPAPAHGALPRPRRHRRRDRLPHRRGDHRRPGPRPAARAGAADQRHRPRCIATTRSRRRVSSSSPPRSAAAPKLTVGRGGHGAARARAIAAAIAEAARQRPDRRAARTRLRRQAAGARRRRSPWRRRSTPRWST